MSLKDKLSKLIKGSSFASIVGLSSSAFVGQLISIANLILITKYLFTQEDFGLFSLFLSYSGIASTFALLSLDKAIPIESDDRLSSLIQGIMLILLVVSIATGIVLRLVLQYELAWMIILFVFFTGLIQLAQLVNIRNQNYKLLSFSRVAPHLLFTIMLLPFFGGFEKNEFTLVFSRMSSLSLVAIVYFLLSAYQSKLSFNTNFRQSYQTVIKHKRFIYYASPANYLNKVAFNLPIILIERYFGAAATAQYSLTLKLGLGPLSVIGSAISQVYHGNLAKGLRKQNTDFLAILKSNLKFLLPFGLVIFLGAVFILPLIIHAIYGDEWADAITYIRYLSPFYGIIMVVVPISVSYFVFEEQFRDLVNQLIYFSVTLISFGIGIYLNDIVLAVMLFSFLSFCRYAYMYYEIYMIHKKASI